MVHLILKSYGFENVYVLKECFKSWIGCTEKGRKIDESMFTPSRKLNFQALNFIKWDEIDRNSYFLLCFDDKKDKISDYHL